MFSFIQTMLGHGKRHRLCFYFCGFNIAILAELFSKLFGKVVSRWWATLLSIFAISLYTLMVGAAPSVVRAAIMGSLSLIPTSSLLRALINPACCSWLRVN